MDLALNNQQRLICRKTQTNKQTKISGMFSGNRYGNFVELYNKLRGLFKTKLSSSKDSSGPL